MYVVLLEDDYLQAELIEKELKRSFPNLRLEIISTEQEFYQRVDQIAEAAPDVAVLDVMVRWTDPSLAMPPAPKEVTEEGFFRAGLRCQKLLHERNSNINVLLYTILEKGDLALELKKLSRNVIHLKKESDPQILMDKIRILTST
jgi:DNA-binding NarL/FixJ family response regulator